MPKIELLPCPLCSGKAETFPLDKYDSYGNHEMLWYSECGECFARSGYYNTEGEAAIAWNTRASGWIPVWVRCDEAMPEDGDYIVMTEGSVTPQVGCYSKKYACWMDWEGCTMENVTLWTTLPDPPKGDTT